MQRSDFSTFRHESLEGALFAFGDTLRKEIGRFVAILAFSFINENTRAYLYFFAGFYLITLIIRSILRYQNFQFRIDDEKKEFQLKKGVFKRELIIIPLEKIQMADLSQNFFHRLLNIYAVKLDTGGSAKEEVEISALKQKVAEDLLSHINNSLSTTKLIHIAEKSSPVFHFKVYASNLLWSSIFSNHFRTILVLFGFIAAFYNRIRDFFDEDVEEKWIRSVLLSSSQWQFSYYIFVFITLFLLILVLYTCCKNFALYFPFHIKGNNSKIEFTYGSLSKNKVGISPSKLQIIKVQQNYFEKIKKILNLRFTQINENRKNQRRNSFIPAIERAQMNKILDLFSVYLEYNHLWSPNYRLLILHLRNSLFLVGIIGSLLYYSFRSLQIIWIASILLILLWLWNYFQYKNTGYFMDDKKIQTKKGAFQETFKITQIQNVQSVVIQQKIWHKKSGVCHYTFKTAGGKIRFLFLDKHKIDAWVNKLLYHLEA